MITSLLIANRGEIACRIMRTARRMGVRTVAVYSDADAKALHVREADEAVHIGASPARESYLVGEKIIAAAQETGAEAVHPGYGFLSENAEFAQAVIDAGLIWVGPNPASITAMGLKDAAKTLMQAAGVPVTPGYLGEDQSEARLRQEAENIGWPVLIKAVAGGGGKGMRKVEAAGDFADALGSCRREAAAAFGNTQVLLEKWITNPRHIEVQVFGDSHGNVVHLFERDCSLQRRHQKVIEEAPAPGMNEATRAAICEAAVRAAKAVDYVGAGTIEFIADASDGLRADRIWFMEMNTRLQVEHPVTEEITGVDLVEWQLRVASGEELPLRQEELAIDGWAIEARLYAENPAAGFLPSTGKAERLHLPALYRGIRVDTGLEQGDLVTPFYDPMIAKIIAHGPNRATAIDTLKDSLNYVLMWPVKTNAGFLQRCLFHEAFVDGAIDTSLIERSGDALMPSEEPSRQYVDWAAGTLVFHHGHQSSDVAGPHIFELPGFRLNAVSKAKLHCWIDGRSWEAQPEIPRYRAEANRRCDYEFVPDGIVFVEQGQPYVLTTSARTSASSAAADGAILSPMPGRIIAIAVEEGEAVANGQKLVTLEAMKMEHSLVAPFDGTVAELAAREGGQVSEGTLLVRIEAVSSPPAGEG